MTDDPALSPMLPPTLIVDASRSPYTRLRPVPASDVRLTDDFWEPRRRANRETTLPGQYAHLESSGVLSNFRRAADPALDLPFQGRYWFMDTDLYKWLEGASFALREDSGGGNTATLAAQIDAAIGLMEAAQRPDGYLNTYFARDREGDRWTNLRDWHELYNAGHLIQASVAHFRATGTHRLLDLACRVADNLCATFGPEEDDKIVGTDGHPEIELALVELFRATGEPKYLAQAQFFVAVRGRVPSACYDRRSTASPTERGTRYHQDHLPFADLDEVTGHAVRALYLAAGVTDLVLETGDPALRAALDRQWQNRTTRRAYVTGGLGARHEGEAFGKDFELPADRAYTETCAAIAGVMWDHRMLLLTGDARYADSMEWTLYNAVLPGLSLSGDGYFYPNPLSDDGTHRRVAWFGCACCPPNVARTLAHLPGYFFGADDNDGVFVHLYARGTAEVTLPHGTAISLSVDTGYPFDGDISVTVNTPADFALHLRIPGWCGDEGATLTVNGEPVPTPLEPGTYAVVRRAWQAGDTVCLHLPMPPRLVEAHPYVTDAIGRVALARGPLLYCVEAVDHPEVVDVRDLCVSPAALAALVPTALPDLPAPILALRGPVSVRPPVDPNAPLYRPVPNDAPPAATTPATLTAVPYYTWANRVPGRMEVWLRR